MVGICFIQSRSQIVRTQFHFGVVGVRVVEDWARPGRVVEGWAEINLSRPQLGIPQLGPEAVAVQQHWASWYLC